MVKLYHFNKHRHDDTNSIMRVLSSRWCLDLLLSMLNKVIDSAPPEVQHRVGDGRSSVFKGLNDDGETFTHRGRIKLIIILKSTQKIFQL